MTTNFEKLEITPSLLSWILANACNARCTCKRCHLKNLCDKAFGLYGSGCFEEDWLEWLQEESDT